MKNLFGMKIIFWNWVLFLIFWIYYYYIDNLVLLKIIFFFLYFFTNYMFVKCWWIYKIYILFNVFFRVDLFFFSLVEERFILDFLVSRLVICRDSFWIRLCSSCFFELIFWMFWLRFCFFFCFCINI